MGEELAGAIEGVDDRVFALARIARNQRARGEPAAGRRTGRTSAQRPFPGGFRGRISTAATTPTTGLTMVGITAPASGWLTVLLWTLPDLQLPYVIGAIGPYP